MSYRSAQLIQNPVILAGMVLWCSFWAYRSYKEKSIIPISCFGILPVCAVFFLREIRIERLVDNHPFLIIFSIIVILLLCTYIMNKEKIKKKWEEMKQNGSHTWVIAIALLFIIAFATISLVHK